MNIVEYLDSDNFVLSEGLVFLKNSKRLMKLADKYEKKLANVQNPKEAEEINSFIDEIKVAANSFADVENLYDAGKKLEAKAEYKKLSILYHNLMKKINKQSVISFLINAGSITLFTTLLNAYFATKQATSGSSPGDLETKNGLYKMLHDLEATKNTKRKSELISQISTGINKL